MAAGGRARSREAGLQPGNRCAAGERWMFSPSVGRCPDAPAGAAEGRTLASERGPGQESPAFSLEAREETL